ncbi:autotransporter outer membrane beta-barrel domain-containing protein [Selenomonas sputigena]|uniref:autotransporter outer membrane beta-barrel domain-containing protein n=1 Tax=Selenomonas sputigena TaxID=69823 RepID=UPI0022303F2C|nr:autotransporter outer membrane beta-barrel domain-containing protein [Selenomonas sputigena]UZD42604.1 autotransporter outer membrane beta-barrel domain-containing protein [Selenomonas sputigena]
MFTKKSSRHSLALFVALALGSGALLAPSAASAADVNGQNVEIDDAHAPSDNAVDPGGGPAFGTAAGFIGNASDSGNVTNNTLTFNGRTGVYGKSLFGGFTFGTGTVEGNRVFVNPTTTPLTSSVDGNISGGVSNGGGNVKNNHAVFDGNYLYSRKLIGGMAQGSGAGIVEGNTALLKGNSPAFGAVPSIYGGMATDATNGDVLENEATIEGGHASSVYGGYADTTGVSNVIGNTATIKGGNIGDVHGGFASGTGKVTGNTVTIKGGIINGAYGGYSEGSGEVSGNIVNLGDGTATMAAGYAINGTIYGGRSDSHPDKVSNNTLNVKTNAEAHNIKNFSTINFNFNAYTNTTQSLLTLTDTAKTKLQSLKQIDVKNAPVGKGTLMENANGIDVAESGTVGRTEEKTETLIQKDGTTKIAYRTYQFKDSTALDTDGTDVWGGRSRAGNATTGNHVTLNGNYTGDAYGGWTTKFATTVTGESEKNHSKDNWITLEGTTSQVQMMNGGETNVDGGDAADNHAVLNAGTVHSHLTGGESVKGNAMHNFVDINGGTVQGDTTGGAAGNAGKAELNEVTITNGTLNGDARGGWTWDGDAEHNTVKLTGGTAEKVYGGYSKSAGKATHNIVKLSGGSALDVYGGYAKSNDTEHNTVEISSGTARSVYGGESDGTGKAKDNTAKLTGGTLTGDIFGGSAKNGDAVENIVNIEGGSTSNHDAYGGFSTNGNATGNTVNITGGSVRDVYGGWSTSGNATKNIVNITGGSVRNVDGGRSASGNATGNIVNIGSADAAFGGSITGIINGGSGTTYGKDYRTGNTLNVYGNVAAPNISNFAKINFYFNQHVTQSSLTLSDVGGTTIESLSDLNVDGEHGRKGVLLQNTPGSITITDGQNRRIKTSDDKELILEKSTDNKKITYEGYRFANATEPTTITESGVTSTWGGRSIGGNSTRKNVITVASGTHTNIYGGWTAGSGTTADDKDNSYKNEVTLDGSSTTTDNLYGGYVDTDAGNAEENTVTVKNGTVTTAVYGGTTNKVAGTGYVKENIVNISGGTVSNVYGGYSAGSGEVSGNKVTATGGIGFNDVRGGYSTSGAANGNKVTLGAVSTGAVTGSHGATAADGNEVTLTGTTVTGDVKGGEGATTNNNTINLNGNAQVIGTLTGGSQASGTGNTLNVKGTNSAGSIAGFQKLHFDTDTAAGTPMLTLSTAGASLTLASIESNGAATENPTTLVHNAAGLNVADAHQPKSTLNAEGTRETNLDVRKTGALTTDIVRYAYTFKGARTPISVTEGGVTNTWGGRSKAGNTTTDNKITVASGTHTNVYGGWTAGSGTTAAADKQNDSSNNTVTVTGGTVANLYGGYTEAATGQTTGNTVNIGDGEHPLASGTSLGTLSGGNKDATANTLNVRANATASQIENFSNVTFEFNHVINRSSTLLNLTNTTGTTLASLSLLNVSGTPNGSGTLIQNSNGITISDGMNTRTKTGDSTEATFQAHSDKVTYEGYTFKGVKGEHAETTDGANTWGGRSKLGNTTTENEIAVSAHNHTNVYGGWTTGTGSTAAADKQKNSIANKVKINGSASVTGAVYGGFTNVVGGKATANEVTIEKNLAANIVGGKSTTGEASNNTVNLANATVSSVTGGEGAATNDNTVNLNGNANVTGALKGGSAANGTGNTLNVKGKDNKAGTISNVQNMNFDATGLAKGDTMLEATGAGETTVDWANLKASGTAAKPLTLLKNANGINLAGYTGAVKSETTDTTETNIDVRKTGGKVTEITYEGYQFKDVRQATTVTDAGVTNTFGGRSKAGNSTRDNEITVEGSTHTNVYGGWTSGSGTTAADKDTSYKNKVTVNGSANVTGTVYGGFTEAAGGKATGNEVTIENAVHDVVGGQAAGEASGNTVTVSANAGVVTGGKSTGDASGNIVNLANATVNSVTGGEGATTNNNTINLNGNAQVAGTLTGGSQASGTGNTLNVKGKDNKAGTISNIQNMNFDATGLAKDDKMLEITGAAQSDVDWTTLRASGTATKPLTLLKNDNGINLAGYTGAAKSETGDTTETNIDVRKTGGKVTEITYEGYQFKGVTQATTDGDTFGGISKAGNSTRENEINVESGIHANIYGGWTTGSGTTAADKDASYKNKVKVNGSASVTGTVYGGFSDVADGKATSNEVTIEKNLAANVVGGEAKGEASGNTVTVSANANTVTGGRSTGDASNNIVNLANATVSSVTGGEGATTNNNIVNLNGNAQVTGALKGGSQANGTGNTLNVKGKDNKAGTISNVQNMNFDATGLAKGDTMLEATDAGETDVDWTTLRASGMATKPLTLLKNDNGINLAGYTGAVKSETGDTTETNIDVRKTGGKVTEITYEGYQFKGVTQATTDGDTFGGRSKAGNSTRENEINVESGTHANVYGGWTSGSGTTAADKGASYKNKVKVSGSASVTGTVYGGFAEAAGGKATSNEVTVTGGTVHDVVGGEAKGEASGNTVTVSANVGVVTGGRSAGEASGNIVNLANATVSSVTGGEGAATNENTVNLNGGANVTGVLKGGSAANGTGNTLNVNGVNRAGSVTGFQKMNFDATGAPADAAMLHTTGATDVNWETLTVKNAVASEKPLTLLENANGINISGRTGDAARSELNADATMETNIDVHQSGGKVTAITYEGYTFKGAAKATTYGADTWAGRSKAGNTTQDNKLTLDDASKTYANVYGGWTSGTGTKAAADKQNNSLNNTVDYTAGTVTGTLYGGYAAAGEASDNTVNLGAITTAANIYGGFGTATKNNTINLKGARITGTVYGGSDANGMGNTLAVYKPSEVHDFAGVQNLHFYTDEMAANVATPMLKLGTATKDIRGLNIGVARSGAAPKLIKGDKILLMKTAGGALATDAAIQNKVEGMQGVSRRYEYEIKQEVTGELTATVTKAGFAEQAKSLVETRAGLAGFVNQGADYLVQDGLAAAEMSVSASDADKGGKNAQRQGASSDGAAYQLWAGAGANSMRAESGSYVDSKGWNLGVGWAREDVQKDGAKVLFSPFVEYGRGTYDSYLDDGTHGSGKVSYIGAGILGKLTQKDGLWLEGSLRAGRSKSDYSANLSGTAASYDGSNTYYGAHLGAGKTFAIKEDSSIDAYARYFWSHQNSMTATLNTGDVYEFGSVNSQRLRLGLRYSLKDKTTGEFYAGLAWEHEFAGKAGATYQGDAAPSPSLKGSSTMLELGYRFMPKNSRVSYDLHLNGWQGKRKGITGGASVKWAF